MQVTFDSYNFKEAASQYKAELATNRLAHVDVKGVLKFLVNTSWVEGGMDSGIHWMEHVVCLSDFFVFSPNGTSEQKGL